MTDDSSSQLEKQEKGKQNTVPLSREETASTLPVYGHFSQWDLTWFNILVKFYTGYISIYLITGSQTDLQKQDTTTVFSCS